MGQAPTALLGLIFSRWSGAPRCNSWKMGAIAAAIGCRNGRIAFRAVMRHSFD
jgi:hypothetical protein